MSGLIWIRIVDTLMVFLIEVFEKDDFEKNQQTTSKKACKITKQAKNKCWTAEPSDAIRERE